MVDADEARDESPLARVLARFDDVRAVRELVGGRGRTVAVDHGDSTSVVHLRTDGPTSLEREAQVTAAAHAVGVGPEVLDVVPELGALVTRWLPGRPLTSADLADDTVVTAIAGALRRLHAAPVPDRVWRLDPTADSFAYMDEALRRGLGDSPADRVERARLDAVAAWLDTEVGTTRVLCHGDPALANLLRTEEGVAILDYEYSGVADPAFDLGGFAAAAELDDSRVAVLVDAYGTQDGVTVERVVAWRGFVRYAWTAWVALDPALGPERERWVAWASRARDTWRA